MKPALAFEDPQMRASYRRDGEREDRYLVWTEGCVLRIEARGCWDLDTARAYTSDIARIIGELRLIRPHLRAIVDRSNAPVFAPGVSEVLMATYQQVMRAGDRIGLVVDSSLMKAHYRRVAGREETQIFLSTSAALTWVLAYG